MVGEFADMVQSSAMLRQREVAGERERRVTCATAVGYAIPMCTLTGRQAVRSTLGRTPAGLSPFVEIENA